MTQAEQQKDNAEKGLREAIWLAIYFADQLKLDHLGNAAASRSVVNS